MKKNTHTHTLEETGEWSKRGRGARSQVTPERFPILCQTVGFKTLEPGTAHTVFSSFSP